MAATSEWGPYQITADAPTIGRHYRHMLSVRIIEFISSNCGGPIFSFTHR